MDQSSLLGFVAEVAGDRALRVEESFGDGFVRLRVGEAERRQAKHDIRCVEDAVVELLRNARDASARQIYVATSRDADLRTLTVLDDGEGIPPAMQQRVFEARVTSKLDSVHVDKWGVHGRGMALFSIRENAQSAEVMASGTGLGSSLRVRFCTSELPERSDQSTWPTLVQGTDADEASRSFTGPHNICRTCCEFALEEQRSCEVWLGSPAEIIATARRRARVSVSDTELLFTDDLTELPVLERLRYATGAQQLMELAGGLGLEISERTAHRILSGQIKPLRSVRARALHLAAPAQPAQEVDLYKDRRGLKLHEADVEEFSRSMAQTFEQLASKYYLELAAEPRVRVSGSRITVTFEVDKLD